MEFSKFRSIIEFNQNHKDKITGDICDFYSLLGIERRENILKVDQIARMYLDKKKYILFQLPLKDKEIGAMTYKGDFWGYLFINSSISKVNINFALCHELYHIAFQPDAFKNLIELYIEDEYHDDENEKMANLFAGAFLMPELSFVGMFRMLKNSSEDEIEMICKLMNYYEVPYMAVVIRCYELGLLGEDSDLLKKLLNVDNNYISSVFEKKWLDKNILKNTNQDDFEKIMQVINHFAEIEVKSERMKSSSTKKIAENIKNIYSELV